MQRSTHLTQPAQKNTRTQPTRGLAEEGSETKSEASTDGQVSGMTMALFVAGGGALAWWVSQEPNQVVAPAPGPA